MMQQNYTLMHDAMALHSTLRLTEAIYAHVQAEHRSL